MAKRKIIDVRRGGVLIPIGNNTYLAKGRTHEQGGIDIGDDLEIENNEVAQLKGGYLKIFSAQPILNGYSPSQLVLGGANPDRVFNAQERFKKANKLNDDGSRKKKYGDRMKYIKNLMELGGNNSDNVYVVPKRPEWMNTVNDITTSVIKTLDPTGISNIEDIYKSFKDKDYIGGVLNIISSIPAVTYLGKIAQYYNKGRKLNKLKGLIDYSNRDSLGEEFIGHIKNINRYNENIDKIGRDVAIDEAYKRVKDIGNPFVNKYSNVEAIQGLTRGFVENYDARRNKENNGR